MTHDISLSKFSASKHLFPFFVMTTPRPLNFYLMTAALMGQRNFRISRIQPGSPHQQSRTHINVPAHFIHLVVFMHCRRLVKERPAMICIAPGPGGASQAGAFFLAESVPVPSVNTLAAALTSSLTKISYIWFSTWETNIITWSAFAVLSTLGSTMTPTKFLCCSSNMNGFDVEHVPAQKSMTKS